MRDAGHGRDHALHGVRLGLERREIGAENLHGEGALEAGLRFVHRVLGRLGVVEDDAGKCLQLLLNRVDRAAASCGSPRPRGIVVRLQTHEVLVVEEADRIGAVVRAPELVRHGRHLRKAQQDRPAPAAPSFDASSKEIV